MSKLYVKAIKVSYPWNHHDCSAYIFARRDAELLAGMGVSGNIRIFYTDHYRISGAARSKAPRTANKRGTSGGEGTGTKSYRTLIIFLFAAILVFSALDWRFQWF
jgi:hypothetical protein